MSLYGSGIYPFWCFHNNLSIFVKSITYKTCSELKINKGNHSTRTLLNISLLFKSCCKLNCLWLCYIVVTLSPPWCWAGQLDLFLCLFARRLPPGWWGNVQKYFFHCEKLLISYNSAQILTYLHKKAENSKLGPYTCAFFSTSAPLILTNDLIGPQRLDSNKYFSIAYYFC